MSRGVNKCILVGNLGNDPEMKYMPSGGAVTNLSIATSESWKDKATGQPQERTEWHRMVFFNKLAEIAGQYLKKGSKVYVEGAMRTRKWQGQDGQDRYTTEIVCNEMQMLDSRGDKPQQQAPQQAPQPNNYAPPQQQPQQCAQPATTNTAPMGQPLTMDAQSSQSYREAPMQQPPQGQPMGVSQQTPQSAQGNGFDNFDDDIPF